MFGDSGVSMQPMKQRFAFGATWVWACEVRACLAAAACRSETRRRVLSTSSAQAARCAVYFAKWRANTATKSWARCLLRSGDQPCVTSGNGA